MTSRSSKTPTTVLIVLDGWGHSDHPEHNAIHQGKTPNWDRLWADRPHTLISGSGLDVGLPVGQMGNSEVGHMNLGAGRVVYQDLTRIDKAVDDGSFVTNAAINHAMACAAGKRLHVMGLLSPGGVHSHENHFRALIEHAARQGADVAVHAFLDGRDTPPRSARASLEATEAQLQAAGTGRIASLCGRYYAMDRDARWDRVEAAYRLLVDAEASHAAADPVAALEAAYARGENDEFVSPTVIGAPLRIVDGDAVVFMNFRADRAREISHALVDAHFDGFVRSRRPDLSAYITMTQYAVDLGQGTGDIPVTVAFASETIHNSLGEHLANIGKTQLRLAETEKYAHVTFFFSGGRETPFEGEQRVLIPSPKVATYDLMPEMSAREVTDELIAAIEAAEFDVIVCNYANGDMVGHTGDFDAAVAAVEVLDACFGRIIAALETTGSQCLITADHGNVERMLDPSTGQPLTAHTSEPVPLVYVGPHPITLAGGGTLADVAPTLLDLMGEPIPGEMTGRSLLSGPAVATAS